MDRKKILRQILKHYSVHVRVCSLRTLRYCFLIIILSCVFWQQGVMAVVWAIKQHISCEQVILKKCSLFTTCFTIKHWHLEGKGGGGTPQINLNKGHYCCAATHMICRLNMDSPEKQIHNIIIACVFQGIRAIHVRM